MSEEIDIQKLREALLDVLTNSEWTSRDPDELREFFTVRNEKRNFSVSCNRTSSNVRLWTVQSNGESVELGKSQRLDTLREACKADERRERMRQQKETDIKVIQGWLS